MKEEWEDVLILAKDRFKQCQNWETYARQNFRDDMKFALGDTINNYQWPSSILSARIGDSKPTLTTNKIHTYNMNIKNKLLQNKTDTKIRAVSETTNEAATIYEGILRHIAYDSNAESAYDTAVFNMIWSGIGWWRIITDYVDNRSRDHKILIRRIKDPLSVYIDPDCNEWDKSDAKFAFIYDEINKKEFNRRYPEYANMPSITALGNEMDYNWWSQDHIRVAEYYCKTTRKQKLYFLKDGSSITEEEIKEKDNWSKIKNKIDDFRWITDDKIDWYLIAGTEIIDHKPWVGKYIPLVCCIGEENVIDGILDRNGNTRCLISPQQMYNTWISAGAEHVFAQTKSPYIAPMEAIEEYQGIWRTMNIENPMVLPYKHKDEAGDIIPPPVKIEPPQYAQGYETGLGIADKDMQAASGIFDAQLGAPSNERTGRAIDARTSNGEVSTFHFNDHLTKALIHSGKIIMDLIPLVYDTERVVRILSQDGKTIHSVQMDPDSPSAHVPITPPNGQAIMPDTITAVLNPTIGEYAVISDVGPDYQTKRLEDLNNLGQLMQQVPSIVPIIADKYVRMMDIDLSDDIADRLARMVPPQALGIGPTPQEQQMHQAIMQLQQESHQKDMEIVELKMKALNQLIQKEIDYKNAITNEEKANTERMKVVGQLDPVALKPIIREMVSQMLGQPVNQIIEAHAMEESQMLNRANSILNPQPQQEGQQGAPSQVQTQPQ